MIQPTATYCPTVYLEVGTPKISDKQVTGTSGPGKEYCVLQENDNCMEINC